MTVCGEIKNYLDDQGINFEILHHRQTFSSGEEARALGIPSNEVAKTLVVKKSDGSDVLAVLPASRRIDVHKLRDILNDNHARLATESEMKTDFSQFEPGAIPPLGDLLGATVILDKHLEQTDSILFAAGTYDESVKINGQEFLKIVHPHLADLSEDIAGEKERF